MKVLVKGYDLVKYERKSIKLWEKEYEIKSFEVVEGERATEIGNETDEASRDEFNEYLVLTFEDGETAIFRNSHVDLFMR